MKNVIRNVGGIATSVLGILLLTSQVRADDFELKIDGSTLREVNFGTYEIDAFLNVTQMGQRHQPFKRAFESQDFASQRLFVVRHHWGNLRRLAKPRFERLVRCSSSQSSAFWTAVDDRLCIQLATDHLADVIRLAFTVLFSTTNANASDVQIEFNSFGNFYERDRDNEGIVYDFAAGLFSSPAITVVKVPEPASCILASLGPGWCDGFTPLFHAGVSSVRSSHHCQVVDHQV